MPRGGGGRGIHRHTVALHIPVGIGRGICIPHSPGLHVSTRGSVGAMMSGTGSQDTCETEGKDDFHATTSQLSNWTAVCLSFPWLSIK